MKEFPALSFSAVSRAYLSAENDYGNAHTWLCTVERNAREAAGALFDHVMMQGATAKPPSLAADTSAQNANLLHPCAPRTQGRHIGI